MILALKATSQSNTPIQNTWITDGAVNAIVTHGSKVYLGGNFTYVAPNTPYGVSVVTNTGLVNVNFVKPNGIVNVAIPDGSGGWYIGGDFSKIGGVSRYYLARINSDGTLNDWNPNLGSSVTSLIISGSTLYVGGYFQTVGAITRNRLASFDLNTGLLNDWNPNMSSNVNSLALNGSTLYVGGYFETVGAITRNRLASFDLNTGLLKDWNPNLNNTVISLIVSGSNLYVGGYFTLVGGSATRNRLASFDLNSGLLNDWNPNMNSDVNALELNGSTLYVGGKFTLVGGSATRNRLASFDINSGLLNDWNPNMDATVYTLALNGSNLYAGGSFTLVGGSTTRNRLASFDINNSGSLTSWDPNVISSNSYVNTISVSDNNMYVGGNFKGINWSKRKYLASVDSATNVLTSWDPNMSSIVNTLALNGSNLYVGGNFSSVGTSPTTRKYLASFDLNSGLLNDWDPNMNSDVNTLALNGNTLYVGGGFSTVGGITRNRLASFDLNSGSLTSWNPNMSSTVSALALNGSTLYAGGSFTLVGGSTTRNRLASFDLNSGSLTSWNPNMSSTVSTLALNGSTLYAGGSFTSVGGITRNRLASFDFNNNGSLTSWDPNVSSTSIKALAVNITSVYVGGNFTKIGSWRNSLAVVDTSGAGIVKSWNPDAGSSSTINSIAISGRTLYVGGSFKTINSQDISNFASFTLPIECANPSNAGTISQTQSGISPFNPEAFSSSSAASGHVGSLEYKWQSSTISSAAGFSDIVSSNTDIYDAGSLSQTTWFRRLAKVTCFADWSGAAASNVLEVTVAVCTLTILTPSTSLSACEGLVSSSPIFFGIEGSNLTASVTVTAPANFEIATTIGGTYSSSLQLDAPSGVVSSTIFIRLTTAAIVGIQSGIITASTEGVTATNTISGTVNSLPTLSITKTDISGIFNDGIICIGANAILTASGGVTYIWNTNAATASLTITPASTTTYSLTAIDLNGCINTASTTVTVNALPVLSTSAVSICKEGSFLITASTTTPVEHGWSVTGSNTVNKNGYITAGNVQGNYAVSYTDGGFCTSSATVTVIAPSSNSVAAITGVEASYKFDGTTKGPAANIFMGYNGYDYGSQTNPINPGFYKANKVDGNNAGCPYAFYIFSCTSCAN